MKSKSMKKYSTEPADRMLTNERERSSSKRYLQRKIQEEEAEQEIKNYQEKDECHELNNDYANVKIARKSTY